MSTVVALPGASAADVSANATTTGTMEVSGITSSWFTHNYTLEASVAGTVQAGDTIVYMVENAHTSLANNSDVTDASGNVIGKLKVEVVAYNRDKQTGAVNESLNLIMYRTKLTVEFTGQFANPSFSLKSSGLTYNFYKDRDWQNRVRILNADGSVVPGTEKSFTSPKFKFPVYDTFAIVETGRTINTDTNVGTNAQVGVSLYNSGTDNPANKLKNGDRMIITLPAGGDMHFDASDQSAVGQARQVQAGKASAIGTNASGTYFVSRSNSMMSYHVESISADQLVIVIDNIDSDLPSAYSLGNLGSFIVDNDQNVPVNGEKRIPSTFAVNDGAPVSRNSFLRYRFIGSRAAANVPVVAKFVDTEGNPVADQVDSTVTLGGVYETEQKDVDGYRFLKMDDASAPATGSASGAVTVIYVYEKVEVPPAPQPEPSVTTPPAPESTPTSPAPTRTVVTKKVLTFTGSQGGILLGVATILAAAGAGFVAIRRRKGAQA